MSGHQKSFKTSAERKVRRNYPPPMKFVASKNLYLRLRCLFIFQFMWA